MAYDGTEFHGWQNQPGLRTVQGVLEQSLRRVLRHQVDLMGSGRTDAGVHAQGQVGSFVTTCPMVSDKLKHAIGSKLPKDISIVTARDVHVDFHAQRSALSKLYVYRIHNTRHRPVESMMQNHTYHFWHELDTERMALGASHLVGEKDFAAMAASGSTAQTTVRTVLRCDVYRHYEEVRVEVEGKGFLYNQVRNMVGTLLQVGIKRWEPEYIQTILESRLRANAGPTAPARGLCLRWVRYPPKLLRPATEGERESVESTVTSGVVDEGEE